MSDSVRDTTATLFTVLDGFEVFDPSNVTVRPDESPLFRHTRLCLESPLRRMPVPLYRNQLEVVTQMLTDSLDYQLSAVKLNAPKGSILAEPKVKSLTTCSQAIRIGCR